MSKRIKGFLEREIRNRLAGAESCVVVAYQGVAGTDTVTLRRTLRERGVEMLVVKNSLAKRALRDHALLTSAEPLFDGPSAICWGAEDSITLARVVQENAGKDGPLDVRGASVEGQTLSAAEVAQLAALPTRLEMVAEIAFRAMAPARRIVSLAMAPARRVAGQIKVLAEAED